jgi:membrane peptidoglycan carboxypeptidase
MRRGEHGRIRNAVSLLAGALITGLLVAAAVFPFVAGPGLLAKAGVDRFESLPTSLTVPQSPQSSSLYASDGKTLITTFYDENRHDVRLNDVAPVMRQAIIAAEDQRFYQHHGVDIKGTIRAFVANQQVGATTQGASTITMQYVRLALEYSATTPKEVIDATIDDPNRKIREVRYALALEKQFTKEEILERYLNVAPFGNGAFGVYAAAQFYFGKVPKDLTLAEAALLAGLVKGPTGYNPLTTSGRPKALERRAYVLDTMLKTNVINQRQHDEAASNELKVIGRSAPNGCTNVTNNTWGFYCDYFVRWWLQQKAFGADEYERENRLNSGGYTIVSSLDTGEQAAAMRNITNVEKITNRNPNALMLAGVEPGTGRIQLMAVNRVFSNDQSQNGPNTNKDKKGQRGNYPNTTVPLLSGGGDSGGYQFGSTFKLFTMLTALSQGIPLSNTITTTSPYVSKYIISASSPAACHGNHYCPRNASNSEVGVFDMWSGFGSSVNTYFVPLEEQVGAGNVVAMAKKLGITFNGDPNDSNSDAYRARFGNEWGAFTLGVMSTTPLQMAAAYATIAADGQYCAPIPVIEIRDFGGAKLDEAAKPRCSQAVSVDVARAAADAAQCPVGGHSAFGACPPHVTAGGTRGIVGKPVAGKTGTTDNDRTAALIVMTKQLAIAGIEADPDNSDTRGYSHDHVNSAVQHTLHDAMVGKQALNFTKPSDKLAFGNRVAIPAVKCQPVDVATSLLTGKGFKVSVNRTPVPSDCPAGTVASTTPSGKAVKGGSVQLNVSSGAPG